MMLCLFKMCPEPAHKFLKLLLIILVDIFSGAVKTKHIRLSRNLMYRRHTTRPLIYDQNKKARLHALRRSRCHNSQKRGICRFPGRADGHQARKNRSRVNRFPLGLGVGRKKNRALQDSPDPKFHTGRENASLKKLPDHCGIHPGGAGRPFHAPARARNVTAWRSRNVMQ